MAYRIFRLLPMVVILGLLGTGVYYVKTRFLDPPPGTRSTLPGDSQPGDSGDDGSTPAPTPPGVAPVLPPAFRPAAIFDPPNFALENPANDRARTDALTRIKAVPHFDASQKAKLVAIANRARGLGCIFVIPFEAGKKTLGARETAGLVSGIKSPNIQRLMTDPTLVFAVLGYTDKQGDDQADEQVSQERAQNVMAVMRERCGVQTKTYAVGMGASSFYDPRLPAKNRLVEIWAVYP